MLAVNSRLYDFLSPGSALRTRGACCAAGRIADFAAGDTAASYKSEACTLLYVWIAPRLISSTAGGQQSLLPAAEIDSE